ncbi:MAG: aminopeptidase [Hoeflea sp.]|nr:aminopeptidase [Alphaproteobacteria bacterium]MBV1724130.1 aminopeptidase [Hoeflea sp.]MBU4546424.1 aminopeptidase [Alphaproteobacteria bacterium]MBU4553058.1 aminopeptidase [Alphaproteobacteria bacterium]MBV1759815.1 aminopeptidase [Hoeflea sp.]
MASGPAVTRIVSRSILLIALAAALAGCTGAGYYAESLNGHLRIMAARQDVAGLVADPGTPAELKARMESASAIRQFASDALDLPDNRSYRSYVDLGRDYVTIAVYAAPEFALAPVAKCFPVYGCVPYQAFFSLDNARKAATALQAQGLDVHVSGVTAYSTLGWTSDPLLSTMFRGGEASLAALVFHELAHSQVYVQDDSAFNEGFATAVETSGVRKWLSAAGDAEGLSRYEAGRARMADFLGLIAEARRELNAVYGGPGTEAQKRAEKAAAIERLRQRYRQMRDRRWNGYSGYDAWFAAPINNARLAATSVYNDLVPDFLRLFELCGGDYRRFYAEVARIGGLDRENRAGALEAAGSCG